ncbi:hypothetical protein O6H91_04G118900 [Diphasiastrum complanatum]|nr:hypothetical protein O6H91_04G118900 [Diphasiastrum complanatum]
MRDCSIERLAAVISSAKLEFGDQLKDVCADAESVLKGLLRERTMAPATVQGMNQQQAEDRKTLKERLIASDSDSNSPENHVSLYRQMMRSTSVDAETTSQTVSEAPANVMPDDMHCDLQADVEYRTCSLLSMLNNFTNFSKDISADQVSDGCSKMPLTGIDAIGTSLPLGASAENCSAHERTEPAENLDLQPRLSLRALLCQDREDGGTNDLDSLPLPFTIDTSSSNPSRYHSFSSDVGQNLVSSTSPIDPLNVSNTQIADHAGGVEIQEVSVFEPESGQGGHSRYHSLGNDATMTLEPSSISELELPVQPRSLEAFRTQSLPSDNRATPSRVSLLTLLQQTDGDGGNFIIMDPQRCTTTFFHYWSEGEADIDEEIADLDSLCCVCMLARKGAAFIPCGHTFCRKCSQRLVNARGTCPLCNKEIREYLNIY